MVLISGNKYRNFHKMSRKEKRERMIEWRYKVEGIGEHDCNSGLKRRKV